MAWNVLGHEWAVAMLARAAERPSHAYLFTGPAQIGKLTLAADFARALNCTGRHKPCGVCRACQLITAGQHPDVRVVRRLPGRSEILVEQFRDLLYELALKPHEGRWRVAVIENCHEANLNAANAFLKTLEEPAPQVVILLTAHNPEAVLATIRSRCQLMPLRPLPLSQVEQALREHHRVEPERAQLLARLSAGRLGWAIEASKDDSLLEERRARLQLILDSLPHGRSARIELAGKLTKDEGDVAPILDLWLSWWRDLLLVKGQCVGAIVNVDFGERLARDATRLELRAIQQYVLSIQAARQQIEQNVNTRLAFEVMLLGAP